MEVQGEQTAGIALEKEHDSEHNNKHPRPQPGPIVKIIINGIPKEIHRGHHTVVEIKNLGGVPLADDLEQVIDGKLVPLPDDGALTIKGGEEFVSHPKDSGSSGK